MQFSLELMSSFIEIKLKFGTWRQNRGFFGTFLVLKSHLGPSPKLGTLSERLDSKLNWTESKLQRPGQPPLACIAFKIPPKSMADVDGH